MKFTLQLKDSTIDMQVIYIPASFTHCETHQILFWKMSQTDFSIFLILWSLQKSGSELHVEYVCQNENTSIVLHGLEMQTDSDAASDTIICTDSQICDENSGR